MILWMYSQGWYCGCIPRDDIVDVSKGWYCWCVPRNVILDAFPEIMLWMHSPGMILWMCPRDYIAMDIYSVFLKFFFLQFYRLLKLRQKASQRSDFVVLFSQGIYRTCKYWNTKEMFFVKLSWKFPSLFLAPPMTRLGGTSLEGGGTTRRYWGGGNCPPLPCSVGSGKEDWVQSLIPITEENLGSLAFCATRRWRR